jgi:hypothetical protein
VQVSFSQKKKEKKWKIRPDASTSPITMESSQMEEYGRQRAYYRCAEWWQRIATLGVGKDKNTAEWEETNQN